MQRDRRTRVPCSKEEYVPDVTTTQEGLNIVQQVEAKRPETV